MPSRNSCSAIEPRMTWLQLFGQYPGSFVGYTDVNFNETSGGFMRQLRLVMVACTIVAALWFTHASAQRPAQTGGPTLYEGARLIVGDGNPPIEASAFLVENNRFTRVGRKGEI